jgi:hypothetical protein
MDLNHENGVDAATSTPNSDSNFGAVESKSHPDSSPVITAPQPFEGEEQSTTGHSAIEQLRATGYKDGDRVYLRAIGGRTQKLEATFPDLPIDRLQALNSQGHGIYFVVNGGGHCDADVTECRAIFYEHDDLEIELQRDLWRKLGLPVPTIQVNTGGNSIHSYWVFREPMAPAQWLTLQSDLLEMADADRSIKNTSRVMRLAGFAHVKPRKPELSTHVIASIEINSGVLYDAAELRELIPVALPEPALAPAPRQAPTNLSSGGGAIAKFLEQKIYPRLGAEQIYVGNDLTKVGNRYQGKCPWHESKSGSAFWVKPTSDGQTYRYACPTCTGNKTHGPVTYVHALRTGRHESPRGQDFIEAVRGLADKAGVGSEFAELVAGFGEAMGPVVHGVSLGLPDGPDEGETETETETVGATTMPATPPAPNASNMVLPTDPFAAFDVPSLAQQLADAATDDGVSPTELIAEVNVLRKLGSVKPTGLLPTVEPAFEAIAAKLGVPPTAFTGILLVAAASQIPTGLRVSVSNSTGHIVSAIIYLALVAISGAVKSPIFDIIMSPLVAIQSEEYEHYKKQRAIYEKEMDEYAKTIKSKRPKGKVTLEKQSAYGESDDEITDIKPTPPPYRRHYVDDVTMEKIAQILADQPGRAIAWLMDELSAMLNGADQYRGGKGNDRQKLLSFYNGGALSVERKGGEPLFVKCASVSIGGTIQPSVLKDQIGNDMEATDGLWARFLWVTLPMSMMPLPDDGPSHDVGPLLDTIYRNLNNFPEQTTLKFSADARPIIGAWHLETEALKMQESSPLLRAAWPKRRDQAYRIALIAHCIEAAAKGQVTPASEISAETLQAAIKFVCYCMENERALYASFGATADDAEAAKISQLVERWKGRTISHRDIRPSLPKTRNRNGGRDPATAKACKQYLTKLCELGYAKPVVDGDFSKVEVLDPCLDQSWTHVGPTLDPRKVQPKPLLLKSCSGSGPIGPKNLEKEDEIEEWSVA